MKELEPVDGYVWCDLHGMVHDWDGVPGAGEECRGDHRDLFMEEN